MEEILLFGLGGHAKVIMDIAHSLDRPIAKIVDDSASSATSEYEVISSSELFSSSLDLPGIVAIGDNWTRSQVVQRIVENMPKFNFVSVIHPSATISKSCTIGEGTVIMPGATVNAGARIGDHVIINSGSVVEHDCYIGNFASIAPRAVLGGGVHVGSHGAISIGASVIHNIRVGDHSVVGAGAAVVKDVDDLSVVCGVPAQKVRSRKRDDKYL